MARQCTICRHSGRAAIEALIVSNGTYRNISEQFTVSIGSITRHKQNCMPAAIQSVKLQQAEQTAQIMEEAEERKEHFVWNALSQMEWLDRQVRLVYQEARAEKDHSASLKALGEVRQQTKLFSELLQGQEEGRQEQLEQEWLNVREVIFDSLAPYPEARRAVARALLALGRDDGSNNTTLSSEQLGQTS